MDDVRFGVVVRMSRIRRGWRQEDLAERAGATRSGVSRIERGQLDRLPLAKVRAVAGPLEIRVDLRARSRGADLDRLADARHSALAEFVLRWLAGMAWSARPEVSFATLRERGVVDIVAWNEQRRALLIVELKTEIVEVGELLATLDRKARLAYEIAALLGLGWRPVVVGVCLLVADTMTNRRRIDAHRATFRAALPDDGRAVARWLQDPSWPLRGVRFVSDARGGRARSEFGAVRRVTVKRTPRRPA